MATPDFAQLGSATEAERRSFWRKPEGFTGMLFLGAGVTVGLLHGNQILRFFIEIASNLLHLGILVTILGALIYLATSRDVRTGVFFLFKTLMRKATGLVIQLDPIAILKTYVEDLKEKYRQMQGNITTLAAQEVKLDRQMSENNQRIEASFQEANKAKSMGLTSKAELAMMEGAGLQQMNETLLPLQRNIKETLAFMQRINESADFLIQKTELQVRLKETQYKIVKDSSNVMRSAISIFKGDPDKRYFFDQSLELINDDMSLRVAEMTRAMDMSADFINSVDVQKGLASDKGAAMLEAYNRGEFKLVDLKAPATAVSPAADSRPFVAGKSQDLLD